MTSRSLYLIGALSVALALLAHGMVASELTVDEVVRHSIEALGGQEHWDALRSLQLTGRYSSYSESHPFTMYRKPPHLYRFEHRLGDWDVTVGYDGEMAWWINTMFFNPADWAVEAPLVPARAIVADAEFGYPLLDYKQRGHQIDFAGKADLDGQDTFHLIVTLARGSTESWYLDADSFLPVARISRGADGLREVEQRTFFSDYREVAGVLVPHYLEIELGAGFHELEIEGIQANVEIGDHLFAMSLPAGMEQLREMVGEWNVKVLSSRLPGLPWAETEVKSSIRASFHGALLEEELSFISNGSLRHVKRLRSYDRFRDVFKIVYFDNVTFHVNGLEGRIENGRLVATNLETRTSWEAKDKVHHNREVIYDIETAGFKVDWEISTDGGKSWDPTLRFIYTRQ